MYLFVTEPKININNSAVLLSIQSQKLVWYKNLSVVRVKNHRWATLHARNSHLITLNMSQCVAENKTSVLPGGQFRGS